MARAASFRHKRVLLESAVIMSAWLGLGCAGAFGQSSSPQSAGDVSLVIRNARVVDVVTGKVLADQTVHVKGDRIAAVSPDLPVPEGVVVVDGADRFLIPGLWDMHVHLAADEEHPRAPEQFAAHGVTGVRDMGGYPETIASIRDAVEAGERTGPRIVAAGNTLNGDAPAGFHRVVSTREEVRQAVDDMKIWGAGFIKIHNQLSPEAFGWMAEETGNADLTFVGHIPWGVGVIDASDAGMKSFEHAEALLEAELYRSDSPAESMEEGLGRLTGANGARLWKRVATNGTALTPTLSAYRAFVEEQDGEERRQIGERLYRRLAEIVPAANAAGVTILAGTDFPRVRAGVGLHQELADLVEAGLTPLEALRAATVNAAAFMELDGGSIAEGRLADMVLLEANPLEDIRNVSRIRVVILRGQVLTREE